MHDYTRFSIFYLPPSGSALAQFGASWLGWDIARAVEVPHPPAPVDVAAVTATPRKYGLHGTLKPPFRLAEGQSLASLQQAMEEVAGVTAAFVVPALRLRRIGRFIALVPANPCPPLADLAGACVRGLDAFRAPASEAELAKRRAAGLSPEQEALLAEWGYPYVLDEFRFHLTLTGALEDAAADATRAALADLTRDLTGPMPVAEICLCGELPSGRFHLIRRYPLQG